MSLKLCAIYTNELISGYDKTFGEMSSSEKHEISHRRRAIDALRVYFAQEEKTEHEKNGAVKETPVTKTEKRKRDDGTKSQEKKLKV